MNKSQVNFESSGLRIGGYLLRAARDMAPLVIISPGFGSTIEHTALKFGEAFCESGYNALVYDQPNFGISEAITPQEVDPALQRRVCRDAITYGHTIANVDASRIALWGSSFCGGNAIEVAAFDRRVRCVISQVPAIDGYEQAQRRTRPHDQETQLARYYSDRLACFNGAKPQIVKLVSEDPSEQVVFPGNEAYDYYMAPDHFINHVTLRSLENGRENRPGLSIQKIAPTPFMMIVADRDTVTPTDIALRAYEAACEPKRLLIVKGSHFSPYSTHFDKIIAESTRWFNEHLA